MRREERLKVMWKCVHRCAIEERGKEALEHWSTKRNKRWSLHKTCIKLYLCSSCNKHSPQPSHMQVTLFMTRVKKSSPHFRIHLGWDIEKRFMKKKNFSFKNFLFTLSTYKSPDEHQSITRHVREHVFNILYECI